MGLRLVFGILQNTFPVTPLTDTDKDQEMMERGFLGASYSEDTTNLD